MQEKLYTCPMHPEIQQDHPGRCPKCGMDLVLKEEVNHTPKNHDTGIENNYTPLFIIIGLILLVSLSLSFNDYTNNVFSWINSISYFMTGFFLVFAGFKLIDLKGFAQGYSTYDLLAQKFFNYGYMYPFIELFFGLAMILNHTYKPLLWAEFIVMIFSGVGVAIKLAKKEKFQCVCLGTAFKLPLTKVTLIEDFGMAFLALVLLILANY